MRHTFDFSTIENQLTGEAINEDFFDDFRDSIINKDNSRRVVDDNAAIVYSQRMILTLMLHHSSVLHALRSSDDILYYRDVLNVLLVRARPI